MAKIRIETRYPLLNVCWGGHADVYDIGICDDYGEQTRGMYDILCHYLEFFLLMGIDEAHFCLIDTSLPPLYGSQFDGRALVDKWVNWRMEGDE